jgi:hypothetical protein
MSATVQKGIEAVEQADAKVSPSAEVKAQERITEHENKKGAKAAAKKVVSEAPKYDVRLATRSDGSFRRIWRTVQGYAVVVIFFHSALCARLAAW